MLRRILVVVAAAYLAKRLSFMWGKGSKGQHEDGQNGCTWPLLHKGSKGQHEDGQYGRTWPLGTLCNHAMEGLAMEVHRKWRNGEDIYRDTAVLGQVMGCMFTECDPVAFSTIWSLSSASL